MRLPILIAAVFLSTAACASTQPITQPIVDVGKSCGEKVLHDAAVGILDDVASVLICERGDLSSIPACVEAGLATVAKKASWDAVWCAVDWVENNAGANAASSADGLEALKRLRASNWKTKHGPGPSTAPPPPPSASASLSIMDRLRPRQRL